MGIFVVVFRRTAFSAAFSNLADKRWPVKVRPITRVNLPSVYFDRGIYNIGDRHADNPQFAT